MSSAKAKAKLGQMEQRQSFRNLWHSDLMTTIEADPPYCVFATLCSPCASYLLRKRALYGDMSRYTCCAGYMPCSGKCGERKCPEFCLFTEVCCCFANSVASTRWLLQDEFNIQTTRCDNCIIGCMTQHKIEMDKRDGMLGPQRVMGVPPMQQMSRMDQDVPPAVGYPGPGAHGQPYNQHPYGQPPPPQAQGYPSAGYPPPPPPPGSRV